MKTAKKRRKKKTTMRIGSARFLPLLLLLWLILTAAASSLPGWAGESGPQAVLGGSVFRDAGFALRGAEATATLVVESDTAGPRKKDKKPKLWKAITDARGEFLLRLPAGPARYNVVVRAAGYKLQEKQVTFAADERQDQNFLLESDGSAK